MTLFNRMEWSRTQPKLADASGTLVANPIYDPGVRAPLLRLVRGQPGFRVQRRRDVF